jgi:hypothetical protein
VSDIPKMWGRIQLLPLNLQSIQHQMRLEKALWCRMVSMEKIYSNIADHLYLLESLLLQSLTRYWQFILHSFIRPQNCHVFIQELTFKTMLQVFQLSKCYYNLAHLLNLCESLKLNTYKRIQLEERESRRIKMEDTN